MDQVTKDKVVGLIRNRFKETKVKPIRLYMKHGDDHYCALGILLKEELDAGNFCATYPRVAQKLNLKLNLNLNEADVIWIASSWDGKSKDDTLSKLYWEVVNG